MTKELENENKPNNENTENGRGFYKEKEFEAYCIWCAIPAMFKGLTAEDLQSKYFIDDSDLQFICSIKNQNEFAEKFGISRNTLTEWKKKVEDRDTFQDIRKWVKKVNKNVVASAYRSAMSKDPKAHQDRKLMLQLDGFSEEQTVNVKNEGLAELIKRTRNIK